MLRAIVFSLAFGLRATLSAQGESGELPADAPTAGYELSCVFAYGGESKLAVLLPRVQLVRKHYLRQVEPYYGLTAGFQVALVSWLGSAGVVAGANAGPFDVEFGLGRWYTPALGADDPTIALPSLRQDLLSLRGGLAIGRVHLRVGHAWELGRRAPTMWTPSTSSVASSARILTIPSTSIDACARPRAR